MSLYLQFNKVQLQITNSRADNLASVTHATLMYNIPPATLSIRAVLGTKDERKFSVCAIWAWKT